MKKLCIAILLLMTCIIHAQDLENIKNNYLQTLENTLPPNVDIVDNTVIGTVGSITNLFVRAYAYDTIGDLQYHFVASWFFKDNIPVTMEDLVTHPDSLYASLRAALREEPESTSFNTDYMKPETEWDLDAVIYRIIEEDIYLAYCPPGSVAKPEFGFLVVQLRDIELKFELVN